MTYSINRIAAILNGHFTQFHHDDAIEHLLLDSRRLIFPDTSLFFALPGPRRDGHLFIEELYQRGVRNFLVYKEIQIDPFPDANIMLVADTLQSLQQLTAYHRQQFDIPIIGITGSNGKTIVKEWLNQLLEDNYNIVRSPKSYNSQIGVPLSVWQINDKHGLGIFEAGISQKNEMEKLEDIIHPTIGVFTNIGEAHNEGFENRQQKIAEKLQLFKRSEVLIYCKNHKEIDQAVLNFQKDFSPKTANKKLELFSWGKSSEATVKISSIKKNAEDTSVKADYNNNSFSFNIAYTDDAAIENIITCVCVLLYLGVPISELQNRLQRLTSIAMRLELKYGINHCSVINDSYSADMSSLKIALDFLSQQQQHPKHTVILSDILESGKTEKKLYHEMAGLLQQKKINRLIGIGERISANRDAFEKLKADEILFYPSTENFIHDFPRIHFRDETILIKGARMFQFEKIDRLLSQQVHQTVMEISLDAMAHNLKQYQQLLKPSTKLMAMVKAFAYGTGSYEIARLLQFHKVDYLAVAYVDEGVELRKAGIKMPIMVMNTEEHSLDALVQYNLEPVIYSFRLLDSIDNFFKKEGIREIPVHIEIETGMNRLGFSTKDISALIDKLKLSSFKLQSVFSHLAASEEHQQDEFTKHQAALFLDAAEKLQHSMNYVFLKHIANTAAIIRHPQLQLDMVRLGIGLYGIDTAMSNHLELKQVAVLKSTIAQIKELDENETVGYNRKGLATGKIRMATIRIGYADGYPRSLGSGAGKMWLNGHLVPTIGSICMDMTMVDITNVPDVHEGDDIIVFGNELSIQQLAEWAGTIAYEILTGISQRVKRIYYEGE
ncbi:MAG: bifunctional UDP-N-acetylmuramoyl-tripeptide:D-alanyl-D-alanine ligase/alanine racemase [Bacteroidetes bacterium]|nr:bifunctional UDP-N-acetylmuramoyl-tripeptide:D-alanyl-D-alanine ligase/alanine racemase [Bacteroidota bacterium]